MRLDLSGVCARLGATEVLGGVDLSVGEGEFVGLVGPNGSGKSTLLRTVYRSLRPTGGVVVVGGDDVWGMSAREAARRTAAVLQDSPAPDGVTGGELVALGRTPHHGLFDRDTERDREIVADALRRTGADAFAHRVVAGLSGGERQRVLLARALAQEPRVLLLDEPTNHLDIRARFELLGVVAELGLTTLAVLHDLDLAARTCDRLVVLDRGRVVAAGGVLETLTPGVMRDVFGVNAEAARHADGVVRIGYDAQPLARFGPGPVVEEQPA
ncbi:ABC transporter ATP-binding protein [Streptodolium elevatio]|uniref:ABC transporter ATP-binding protein n=1 Tax=Streptodolium elevatio TaxID=3157996 RepID=A0ABV3DHR4_9ACTN